MTRTGIPPTSMGSVAAKGPTTKATKYVESAMVSAKTTRSTCGVNEVRETSAPLEIASKPEGASKVIPKVALKSGSSKQGKHRRASVD